MAYTIPDHDNVGFHVVSGYSNPLFNDINFEMEVIVEKVTTPVISPVAGKYLTTQYISIETVTPGAIIYYTTDGSDPSDQDTLYTNPFPLEYGKTIKAIGTKAFFDNSDITSRIYTTFTVLPVTIYPDNSKKINYASEITISSYTPGVSIYYTTDGSVPDNTKTLYSGSFKIFEDITIKAIAIFPEYLDSEISEKSYEIRPRWDDLNNGERWKDVLDVGPWAFEKSHADDRYNEGSVITDASDPRWNIEPFSKIPITDRHTPCGYWNNNPYTPNPIIPIYRLYSSGSNYYGLLLRSDVLINSSSYYFKPADLFNVDIKFIAITQNRSMIIDSDDNLWGVGVGTSGALGLGIGIESTTTPVIVATNVKQVNTGDGLSTIILKNDGTVWVAGSNTYGQLALGDTINRYVFTQVTNLPDVVINSVGAGYYNLYLATDAGIYSVGNANQGDGREGWIEYHEFEFCPGSEGEWLTVQGSTQRHTLALNKRGDIYACGLNHNGNFLDNTTVSSDLFIFAASGYTKVFTSNYSSIALGEDGNLYGAGRNFYGQLAQGDTNTLYLRTLIASNVLDISAGVANVSYLGDDNLGYFVGTNGAGQLGRGFFGASDFLFGKEYYKYKIDGVAAIGAGTSYILKRVN